MRGYSLYIWQVGMLRVKETPFLTQVADPMGALFVPNPSFFAQVAAPKSPCCTNIPKTSVLNQVAILKNSHFVLRSL
jgi:hypothetical protein